MSLTYPDHRLKDKSIAILSKIVTSQRYYDVTDAVVAVTESIFRSEGRIVTPYDAVTTPLMLHIGEHFYQYLLQDHSLVDVAEVKGTGQLTEEMQSYLAGGTGRAFQEDLADFVAKNPVQGIILIGGDDNFYQKGNERCKLATMRRVLKDCPVYPLGASGGAAKNLLDNLADGYEPIEWRYKDLSILELYANAFDYLSTRIIDDISGERGKGFLDGL
ncbi:MAG: hypothetical protein HY051_05765 [Candidatus Aenigmarchaeota archaeon]|nr:hypothetical protein [Candidatus Aenigmarchaeota archaeon]